MISKIPLLVVGVMNINIIKKKIDETEREILKNNILIYH
mgnify:FL=1